jgi:hypothetical protein
MVIIIIEGQLVCNVCDQLMNKNEPYKVNDILLKVACLKCDSESSFSRFIVPTFTKLKEFVIQKIENTLKKDKTSVIDKIIILNEFKIKNILHPKFKNRMTDFDKIRLVSKILEKKHKNFSKEDLEIIQKTDINALRRSILHANKIIDSLSLP